MQKDWHTSDTTTEKIVRQMFARPKVAVRRIIDPMLRLAVRAYDLNKRTEARQAAIDDVMRRL